METAPTALLDSEPMHSSALHALGLADSLIQFPVELKPPRGFDPTRVETWPRIDGRMEYVDGRLLYMPPCGDTQCESVAQVVIEIGNWARKHRAFVVGTSEAGLILGDDVRGADAVVWARADLPPRTGGFRRVAPILAVEVTGQDEEASDLRLKARWYFKHGVQVVWVVDGEAREAWCLTPGGQRRVGERARMPAHPALPGLTPRVRDLLPEPEAPH